MRRKRRWCTAGRAAIARIWSQSEELAVFGAGASEVHTGERRHITLRTRHSASGSSVIHDLKAWNLR